jgi:hypothetical protein
MRRFFNNYKLFLILFACLLFVGAGFYFYWIWEPEEEPIEDEMIEEDLSEGQSLEYEVLPSAENGSSQDQVLAALDIPFVPQAPSGEWDDPVYQDGCEEAAALMVVYWALDKGLTKEIARQEIKAMADYQEENFGEYRDTAAQDTVERIIKGYFGYEQAEVKEISRAEDIIKEIKKSRAVIVPANGQLLNNPYYTPPGPERHNLVVRGYDVKTDEFITNDGGTKRGELYRYPKEILFKAIRDYPTGYHQPIISIEKVMIVVDKD